MTLAPYGEAIQDAVDRETERRKRVLLAFLGLLVIPIAIGAYALLQAPSEVTKVAQDVTPIVAKNVDKNISERVTADVVARAQPVIRSEVAAAETRINTDLNALREADQRTLEFVNETKPKLVSLNTQITTVESTLRTEFTNTVNGVGASIETKLRGDFATKQQLRDLERKAADDLQNAQTAVDRKLVAFRTDLDGTLQKLRAEVDRANATAKSNKDAVESLDKRFRTMEAELRKRIGTVEETMKKDRPVTHPKDGTPP